MNETSYVIYLDDSQKNRYRHRHIWKQGQIVEFVIQYEAYVASRWRPILRYDSAHGQPHRDLLRPDGSQIKEFYPHYSNAEIMTIGQRDIIENWQRYRTAYEKELSDE